MNIKILKWLGPQWKGKLGGVKRTGRDEPIGVLIRICMEKIQRISLYIFLYLKLAKASIFSFTKLENRRAEQALPGRGFALVEGGGGGEMSRRMNMVQTMYTHVFKSKNDTCRNCSRNQGRGDEKEQRRG
jgi:hypothetical protein